MSHLVIACALIAALLCPIEGSEFKNKPLLTIKLPGSYKTQSFVDGAWTEPVDFDDSPLAEILELCTDTEDYTCFSESDGIYKRGLDAAISMSNVIGIVSPTDREQNYFCATSWSGFDQECLLRADSPEGCARTLPKTMVQSFVCFKLNRLFMAHLMDIYRKSIMTYTDGTQAKVNPRWIGGFVEMDANVPEFSNRTGLFVTIALPMLGAPNFEELEFAPHEDVYQHFAELMASHLMVRTCTSKLNGTITSIHGLGDPMVFNVHESLHPVLGELRQGCECIDNVKLAYSVPLNKQRDEYYVCHGDLPRNMDGRHRGGGLYCWVDKQLNLDLRCNTVPDYMWMEDRTFARFAEEEYAEWFSDCPEHLRRTVMAATKAKFAEFDREEKTTIFRDFHEL